MRRADCGSFMNPNSTLPKASTACCFLQLPPRGGAAPPSHETVEGFAFNEVYRVGADVIVHRAGKYEGVLHGADHARLLWQLDEIDATDLLADLPHDRLAVDLWQKAQLFRPHDGRPIVSLLVGMPCQNPEPAGPADGERKDGDRSRAVGDDRRDWLAATSQAEGPVPGFAPGGTLKWRHPEFVVALSEVGSGKIRFGIAPHGDLQLCASGRACKRDWAAFAVPQAGNGAACAKTNGAPVLRI